MAGSYGGQTSVTGVNVRTRIAGIFASRLEVPMSSPYELLRKLPDGVESVDDVVGAVERAMKASNQVHADAEEASAYQRQLVQAFEQDDAALRRRYEEGAAKVADMFEKHFGA